MWLNPRPIRLARLRTPTRATLLGISDGPGGAQETLIAMRRYVQDAVRDPQQRIRELTLSFLPRGRVAQVCAIQQWVQQHIRYVRDPPDLELVQEPLKTVEYGAGDCDDQATLMCAMLQSSGHPCRFMVFAFNGGPLEHVVAQTKLGNTGQDRQDWVTLETIQARPPGWEPPNITSRYIRKI